MKTADVGGMKAWRRGRNDTPNRTERPPQTEMGAGIAASPHLHRAKDLPVFASLTTRGSSAHRSWLTRSGVASDRGPARGQVLDLPRPFLGQSPFASPAPRRKPRVATGRLALPAPLPAGPIWAEALLIACRWRSDLPSLPHTFLSLPTVRGGWDFRPDHPFLMNADPSRSKRILQFLACG